MPINSEKLRDLRARKGWSPQQAADACKLARPNYLRLEDGRNPSPNLETMERVAGAFGVTLNAIWSKPN